MNRKGLGVLAGVVLLLGACSLTGRWEPPAQEDLETEFTDCSGGETCTLVSLGCCDYCNGGAAIGVVSGMEAEAQRRFGERCGLSTTCTLMGCFPLQAVCVEGQCAIEQVDTGFDG